MDDGRFEILDEVVKVMVLKGYSENTVRLYRSMLKAFLEYYKEREQEKIRSPFDNLDI